MTSWLIMINILKKTMAKYDFTQATPFAPTFVGELIVDELSARKWTVDKLAEKSKLAEDVLNEVISGERDLTPEMAAMLEKAMNIPSSLFLNLQEQYSR